MAHIDNEYHRLAPDTPPTLQQVRPTLEAQPEEPPKARRRVKAWALKLLASIVAVATVFTVVASRGPSWQSLNDWPKVSASSSEYIGTTHVFSKQGSSVQFTMGSRIYRLTASGNDLCFLWESSHGLSHGDAYGSAELQVGNRADGWVFSLFLTDYDPDDEKKSPYSAYSTISASDGRLLYLEAVSHLDSDDTRINTPEELQQFLNYFVTHTRIDVGSDSGWGKLLVGDTMYSDIYQYWTGVQYNYDGTSWFFRVNYAQDHELTEADIVDTQTINDIEWTFYYKLSTVSGNTEMMLWAVPGQESDIAFGVTQSEIEQVRYNYRRPEPRGGVEDEEGDWTPTPVTPEEMLSIVSQQLVCYHLLTDGNYK